MRFSWKPALLVIAGMLLAIPALAETIKLGVAGPMTGAYAKFGEQLQKGALMAVKHINENGGIDGDMIEVVIGDDQCDPKQARTVANSLVSQDIHAVVGHFCSSSSIPASEVYDEAGILQITPASTNPAFTERGLPAVFRTCGRDDQQGDVAGAFLASLGAKRIAVIHDKDTYGQGLADATKEKLHSLGLKEVLYEGITRGEKDFNSLVTKMKGLKVDAIYFGGLHSEAGLIVRQAREQGLKAPFISGDGIVSSDFSNIAGSATSGVYMTFGADPRKLPQAAQVVKAFRADGYEPEAYTLYSYSTVQIIAQALRENKTSDSGELADYIRSHTFSTVMGPKSFDEKGDLKVTDYVVYQWSKKGSDYVYNEL